MFSTFIIKLQDTFKLLTPGGGGYGQKEDEKIQPQQSSTATPKFVERGSVYDYRSLQESA